MRSAIRRFAFLLVLFSAAGVGAQALLVRDINPRLTALGSDPGGFASIGNVTFFFANDWEHGNELWKTDGTEAGTRLVRDINRGRDFGIPRNRLGALTLNGRVFFVANDGVHGQELWASDGTAEGTRMLADIAPARSGPTGADIELGRVAGGLLYFVATTPTAGRELWRTDGTPAGTRLVKDICVGAESAYPRVLTAIGDVLVFSAWNGSGVGVYITDGTILGTELITFLAAAAGTALGDSLLLQVPNQVNGWSLVRTLGTSLSTTLVRGDFKNAPEGLFAVIGDTAYFTANDGMHGRELWRTDGTAAGTGLVADLTPGTTGSEIVDLKVLNGRLLVVTADARLWLTDGTAAGTRLVAALPNAAAGIVVGNTYYFASYDETHGGYEPWKSDGTPEGTMRVADIDPGERPRLGFPFFVPRPDGFFFVAANEAAGLEPWVSDGTAAGTRMVKNVARETAVGSYPKALGNAGGTLLFSADDGTSTGLWKAEGLTATRLELPEGAPEPMGIAVVSGGLYYFLAGGNSSRELWRSDGTVAGTFRLFAAGENGSLSELTPFRNGLLFHGSDAGGLDAEGSDAEHGAEPWFTDGTVAGTRMVGDLEPGPSSSGFYGATAIGEYVYFAGDGGTDPWRTDGTAAGTQPLPIPDDQATHSPQAFTRVGDSVFFAARIHDGAFNLWRSDYATGELTLVRHFAGQRAPIRMGNAGGLLVFTLWSGEVWRSDGTEAGTVRIAENVPVPECLTRTDFVEAHGLYYWYVSRSSAPELWRSDGTVEGTFALAKFDGPYGDSLQECTDHPLHLSNGLLYFVGNSPVHGPEPWVTDGTAAGTRMLADIDPGPAPSSPWELMTVGDMLYLSAADRAGGYELWALPLGESPRRRSVRK